MASYMMLRKFAPGGLARLAMSYNTMLASASNLTAHGNLLPSRGFAKLVARRPKRPLDSDANEDTNGSDEDAVAAEDAEQPAKGPSFLAVGAASHVVGKLPLMKITTPTPVQVESLRIMNADLNRHPPDSLIHAETGSGKTLAYLLPIFSRLEPKMVPHSKLRAIIVTPTRELSLQVTNVAEQLAAVGAKKDPAKAVRVRRVVGEVSAQLLHELHVEPPHILIGTPSTLDSLIPAHVNTGELQCLVLDEADELLRNHSSAAVKRLVKAASRHGNRPGIIAVSATSSFGLQKFATESMHKHKAVIDLTGGVMKTPDTLQHFILKYPKADAMFNTFTRFLAAARPRAVLSFHNTAGSLEALEAHLRAKNVPVGVLGNAYTNAQRARALEGLRTGRISVLLSTEMAARGLDLPRLDTVINFDPPSSIREYVHRAGRAGRLSSLTPGRQGKVVSFVGDDNESGDIVDICKELGVPLSEVVITAGEILEHLLLGPVSDWGDHAQKVKNLQKIRLQRAALAQQQRAADAAPGAGTTASAGVAVGTASTAKAAALEAARQAMASSRTSTAA